MYNLLRLVSVDSRDSFTQLAIWSQEFKLIRLIILQFSARFSNS
jgi:hypothetical protein